MGVISIDCTGRHEFRRDHSPSIDHSDISHTVRNRDSDEEEVRDHSKRDDVGHGDGQCDGFAARVRHTEQRQDQDNAATEEERLRIAFDPGQCRPGWFSNHIEQ